MQFDAAKHSVNLFVDYTLLDKRYAHIPLLYPFLGTIAWSSNPFMNGIFSVHGYDSSHFRLVPECSKADYFLLPYNYWHLRRKNTRLLHEFIKRGIAAQKPILIDAYGDCMDHISIPRATILRLGQYRRKLTKNDLIVPVYTEDLLELCCGGKLSMRQKTVDKPLVGFTGWARLPFWKYPRPHLKDWAVRILSLFDSGLIIYRKGVFWRQEAMKALEASSVLNTNFIVRTSYSGSIHTVTGEFNSLRNEFIKNILESDYTLDVRGDANQSTRFYEVLSLGRIPIMVDTERVMPLENLIDYKKFSIWVDWRDLGRIGDIVADFHTRIKPEDFLAMQQNARSVFENYLRLDGFTKYLAEELKDRAMRAVKV